MWYSLEAPRQCSSNEYPQHNITKKKEIKINCFAEKYEKYDLYISSYLGQLVDVSVCVEVLRPSQPRWVMSSNVSLPNHTFTEQA